MLGRLTTELSELGEFSETLQQEQAALTRLDAAQLASLSDKKLKQAERLNQLAHERIAAFAALGVGSDRASVETWLATQPKETHTVWQALLQLAAAAQGLNRVNGALIANQLQQNQQALSVLTQAANTTAVYGADGQTKPVQPGTTRILGKG